MATHPSTVKNESIKEKMMGAQSHQCPKEKPNKVFDTKQQNVVQEWGSKKTRDVVGINKVEVKHPFVEEPVCFDFGDDYGNKVFLDLDNQRSQGIMVKETNHADVKYTMLSSERDMISSFHKEAL